MYILMGKAISLIYEWGLHYDYDDAFLDRLFYISKVLKMTYYTT